MKTKIPIYFIWLIPIDGGIATAEDAERLASALDHVKRTDNKRAIYGATLNPERSKKAVRKVRGLSKRYAVMVSNAQQIHKIPKGKFLPLFNTRQEQESFVVGRATKPSTREAR